MVDVLEVIFYLICIGVMCLVGNVMYESKKLLKRQQDQVEMQIKKLQSDNKE
ncbi:hypothetical protein ACU6T4_07865 [Avibacterium paragallinarum]|uniref:hypothetical protein n=1 Tax=Avibacterium paragallinarum TaxID=728 RepID=UPI00021ACD07|nr:hypothetical protein [Avibacterium paragallinarum]QIR11115.1 hypothetical protein HBL79_01990 [Avibacterium paragallinarum]QJE10065.1 hypothetical protein HHJ62_07035 [Avibacterium paragallinarum]QJE12259.1 hypothetical protein HHJ61_07040 [Avibacterium paragallinarum]QJE14461.1 hypothetical protein HHJ60_07060 [Avibacterium paragallinarum]QJE16661.1 hypothetical protein HHJ59_07050 [Avibacterium paragallinarum]